MENNITEPRDGVVNLRFSPEAERACYITMRSSVIKLLYLIEAEERGEGDIKKWFDDFMIELNSSNKLCNNKLLQVVIKINGLYDEDNYKSMQHAQIKRLIMESRGILDHLIGDKS